MKPLQYNKELRDKIDEYNLYHYEVAAILGMKPSNFSSKLKMYLTEEDRQKIDEAIEKAHTKKEGLHE